MAYHVICFSFLFLEQTKLPVEKKKKKPLAERIKEKEEAKRQKKKELEEVCSICSYLNLFILMLFHPQLLELI